jgi:hypothetical protein
VSLNDENFQAALNAARPSLTKLDLLQTRRDTLGSLSLSQLESIKFDLSTLASVLEAVVSERYAAEGGAVDHADTDT